MTTIRPNSLPLPGQGAQAQDHGRLAAQRQFFAAALKQAQGAAAPTMAAPAVSIPAQSVAPTATVPTSAAQPADLPQKVLRPGSLIDIRI